MRLVVALRALRFVVAAAVDVVVELVRARRFLGARLSFDNGDAVALSFSFKSSGLSSMAFDITHDTQLIH